MKLRRRYDNARRWGSAPAPRRSDIRAAYDSLTLNCAPSYTLQSANTSGRGTGDPEEVLIVDELAEGWDVNRPDHERLQSESGIGPMLGHVSLESFSRSSTQLNSTHPLGLRRARPWPDR